MGKETSWRNGCVEFSEAGPLRTCVGTTVTTVGPFLEKDHCWHLLKKSAPLEDGGRREDEDESLRAPHEEAEEEREGPF